MAAVESVQHGQLIAVVVAQGVQDRQCKALAVIRCAKHDQGKAMVAVEGDQHIQEKPITADLVVQHGQGIFFAAVVVPLLPRQLFKLTSMAKEYQWQCLKVTSIANA